MPIHDGKASIGFERSANDTGELSLVGHAVESVGDHNIIDRLRNI